MHDPLYDRLEAAKAMGVTFDRDTISADEALKETTSAADRAGEQLRMMAERLRQIEQGNSNITYTNRAARRERARKMAKH